MTDQQRSVDDTAWAVAELGAKLDTIAGAVAAIAATQSDLLAHTAEAEARRSQDSFEVSQRLAALERQALARTDEPIGPGTELDLVQPVEQIADDLADRMALHTDRALAGTVRLIDTRLLALREALAQVPATDTDPGGMGGFEAGAVMGAVQAAWTRLEQRLDSEFDDLSRQLQAMAALLEQAVTSAEAAAARPVVTSDQLRKAASAVKESVVGASRNRRERRGGTKGLGPGSAPPA
jgi:hypothetical protein